MNQQIVFGANAVLEALRGGQSVARVYVAAETKVRNFSELKELARLANVPLDIVPQAKLNELTGTHEHQGLAATISPVEYQKLEDVLQRCGPRALLVILDQVQHPKNLGMILRTAAAAGADAAVITSRGGARLDESVVRSSAGLALNIPVALSRDLVNDFRKLREANFWIYGLDSGGEQEVFQVSWPERVALVMGNETSGLSAKVKKHVDALVRISLAEGVDSLNVAVAAGIALFQVRAGRPGQ